jgi:hypothetical protein
MGSDGKTLRVGPANPPLELHFLHLLALLHAAPPPLQDVEVAEDVLQVPVQLGGALLPPEDRRHWLIQIIFWFCCGIACACLDKMKTDE